MGMNRRRFSFLSSFAFFSLLHLSEVIVGNACAAPLTNKAAIGPHAVVRVLFKDLSAARNAAVACLETGLDCAQARTDLFNCLEKCSKPEEIWSEVETHIRDDYAMGPLESLRGWLVARTEIVLLSSVLEGEA